MSKKMTTTNHAITTVTNEFDTDCGSGSDILIPKILLMQGQSVMVLDGDASFGDFRNSVTKEKLGDSKTPVKILPFFMFKNWTVSKKDGERWVFHGIEEYDAKVNHQWTEERDGEWYKYEESINFYCLMKDSALPIVVNFKSTSKRAGQNIYTQMYVINKSMKKLPFSNWFDLKSVKESKNGNTFAKSAVSIGEAATDDEVESCKTWFNVVKQNTENFSVDNRDHSTPDTSDVSF